MESCDQASNDCTSRLRPYTVCGFIATSAFPCVLHCLEQWWWTLELRDTDTRCDTHAVGSAPLVSDVFLPFSGVLTSSLSLAFLDYPQAVPCCSIFCVSLTPFRDFHFSIQCALFFIVFRNSCCFSDGIYVLLMVPISGNGKKWRVQDQPVTLTFWSVLLIELPQPALLMKCCCSASVFL